MCIYDDGNSVSNKKLIGLFVMQNLGILWLTEMGKNLLSKVSYLESPTLICL